MLFLGHLIIHFENDLDDIRKSVLRMDHTQDRLAEPVERSGLLPVHFPLTGLKPLFTDIKLLADFQDKAPGRGPRLVFYLRIGRSRQIDCLREFRPI